MDINLIPTIGGGVLLFAIWTAAIAGRAYVRKLRAIEEAKAAALPPSPDRD